MYQSFPQWHLTVEEYYNELLYGLYDAYVEEYEELMMIRFMARLNKNIADQMQKLRIKNVDHMFYLQTIMKKRWHMIERKK